MNDRKSLIATSSWNPFVSLANLMRNRNLVTHMRSYHSEMKSCVCAGSLLVHLKMLFATLPSYSEDFSFKRCVRYLRAWPSCSLQGCTFYKNGYGALPSPWRDRCFGYQDNFDYVEVPVPSFLWAFWFWRLDDHSLKQLDLIYVDHGGEWELLDKRYFFLLAWCFQLPHLRVFSHFSVFVEDNRLESIGDRFDSGFPVWTWSNVDWQFLMLNFSCYSINSATGRKNIRVETMLEDKVQKRIKSQRSFEALQHEVVSSSTAEARDH